MTTPIYPDICVQLTGLDSNAMSLIAEVARAMRGEGIPEFDIGLFAQEAMSSDYDNVIQTCMKYVTVS